MDQLDKKILAYLFKDKADAMHLLSQLQLKEDNGARYFFDNEAQWLYRAAAWYIKKYREPVTHDVIQEVLKAKSKPPDVQLFYSQLVNELKTLPSAHEELNYHIDQLKKRYYDQVLRTTLRGSSSDPTKYPGVARILQEEQNPFKALELLKKTIYKIDSDMREGFTQRSGAVETAVARGERYMEIEKNPEQAKGIMTGFQPFDEAIYGLKSGEVLVIAGKAGTGKSITLLNIGKHAFYQGYTVVYISLEMPKELLEARWDSCASGLPYNMIERGTLGVEERKQYFEYLADLSKRPNEFIIVDTVKCTADTIEAEIEMIKHTHHPDLIIIDYLDIMQAVEADSSDWLTQGKIAEEIKRLAREHNIPIVTAVQMSKNKAGMQKTHDVDRLSRSYLKAVTVDFILMIDEGEDAEEEKLSDFIKYHPVKTRRGTLNTFAMHKRFLAMQITNMPQDQQSMLTYME